MGISRLLKVPKAIVKRGLTWLTLPQAAILFGELFFYLKGLHFQGDTNPKLARLKSVLVVRLDEIGDVVMTTPFLRELRRNLPEAWITLVVKPQVYNLVELCPYVNEILTYDRNTTGRWPEIRQLRRHVRALQLGWKRLWRRGFDLAVNPRWDNDLYHGIFLLYFSGAPWRVAYSEGVIDRKRQANAGFDRLLTHPLNDSDLKHEVEHNLDVIRYLGGEVLDDRLELWLGEEDEEFAEQFLGNHWVKPDNLLVGLAPGAGESKRMWPIDCFAQLGLWLQEVYGARLLVVGGPGEEPLGEELERALGDSVVNAVGRATLRQTAALLKRCRIFVGNDAGPMHIGAAVGVPVVEISCHPMNGKLSHPNSPKRFGPWGVSSTILQPERALPPCSEACEAKRAHCILGITVEQVKQAVAEQLRQYQCTAEALRTKRKKPSVPSASLR